MDFIVLIFFVTFSPLEPSPLVAAISSIPFIYNKFIANPSNFGSTENCNFLLSIINFFSILSIYKPKSFKWKTLFKESICCLWSTVSNLSSGSAPTLCVGESWVTRSGNRSSKVISLLNSTSYSWSVTLGSSKT